MLVLKAAVQGSEHAQKQKVDSCGVNTPLV